MRVQLQTLALKVCEGCWPPIVEVSRLDAGRIFQLRLVEEEHGVNRQEPHVLIAVHLRHCLNRPLAQAGQDARARSNGACKRPTIPSGHQKEEPFLHVTFRDEGIPFNDKKLLKS